MYAYQADESFAAIANSLGVSTNQAKAFSGSLSISESTDRLHISMSLGKKVVYRVWVDGERIVENRVIPGTFQVSEIKDFNWLLVPLPFSFNLQNLRLLYPLSRVKVRGMDLNEFNVAIPLNLRNDQFVPAFISDPGNALVASRTQPYIQWACGKSKEFQGVKLPTTISLSTTNFFKRDGKTTAAPGYKARYRLNSASGSASQWESWEKAVHPGNQVQSLHGGKGYTVVYDPKLGSIEKQLREQVNNWARHDHVVADRKERETTSKAMFGIGGSLLGLAILALTFRKTIFQD